MHHAYIFSSIENSCMYLPVSQSVIQRWVVGPPRMNRSKKNEGGKRSGKKNNINIWMTCFQGWLVFKTKVGFSQYKLMIDKKTHWDLFICVVWDALKNLNTSLPKRKTQVLGSIPWSGKKSTKPKYLLFHGVKKTLVFVIEKTVLYARK